MTEQTQELLLTRGLPASGKSTFAQEWVAADPINRARVNRDDIRFELFNEYYPTADANGTVKEKEDLVTQVEHDRIVKYLAEGKSVVSDNTNLNPRVFKTYGDIAAAAGVPLRNKDFPISIEETIRRNNARERVVPEYVIRRMAKDYLSPTGQFHLFPGTVPIRPFVKPETKRHAVIYDMDGTLTDVRSIRHLVRGKYRNFDGFHRSSYFCPPNEQVLDMALESNKQGFANIIVTARTETYREVTQAWLDKLGIPFENIYMRADGDFRKDFDVKQEILAKILEDYDVVHAVDDNPAVRDMWFNKAGIVTTIVPGFSDEEIESIGETTEISIKNPFKDGTCLRCGKPISKGNIGPRCATKVW